MPRHVLLVVALIVSGTARAEDSKGAPTPEEAVAMMVKNAKTGDIDTTFGLLVDEQAKPLIQWFKAQDDLARSINAHADALDAAFGKDEKSPVKHISFDSKAEVKRGFEGFQQVGTPKPIDENTASLTVQMTMKGPDGKEISRQESVKAKKTPTGWKLLFNELAGADFASGVKFMNDLKRSIDRSTMGVKAGTIKDRARALLEMEKDRPASIPGNVPLPRFLTQPG